MKELEKLHQQLENMRYDLFDNYKVDIKERFEIVGRFVGEELLETIDVIDRAIDRIKELEGELDEAQERIEELERDIA